MATKQWQVKKYDFCDIRQQHAALETLVIYPDDYLLTVAGPKVLGHRCSLDHECRRMSAVQCVWAGTNPYIDPHRH